MSDIVERLRDPRSRWVALSEPDPLRLEAADKIEQQKELIEEMRGNSMHLLHQLGQARKALREVRAYIKDCEHEPAVDTIDAALNAS